MWVVRSAPRCPAVAGCAATIVTALAGAVCWPPSCESATGQGSSSCTGRRRRTFGAAGPAPPWEGPQARRAILAGPGDFQGAALDWAAARHVAPIVHKAQWALTHRATWTAWLSQRSRSRRW
eukprot:5044114-Alexandrium_andersonii.AAC.1